MDGMLYILLALGVFAVSAAGTGIALYFLRQRKVMDVPNARSNHSRPTPRGGGIAVVAAILLGLLGTHFFFRPDIVLLPVTSAILLLMLVSFYDDLKGASIRWRLASHIIAIAVGLYYTPMPDLVFQGVIPPVMEKFLLGMAWLWFINLYNFMDGIDGITGSETTSIGTGILLVGAITGGAAAYFIPYGIILAASALAFLLWNWHPAKIFLGDVGSVPLGYITGWLLLQLATSGFLAAAFILPAYYLADSSITLLKRIIRGEKFWEAHSQHFYQQAVRSGYSHPQVVWAVIGINIPLISLAMLSTCGPAYTIPSICIAYLIVGAMLAYWSHSPARTTP